MDGTNTETATAPEDLCYAGEEVVTRAPLGRGWAAVTSHRVLAYNPGGESRRFESVHRPNVSGVSLDVRGDRLTLRWTLRAAAYGAAGLVGGLVLRRLELASALSVGADAGAGAGAVPLGGLLSVVDVLAAGLAALATLLLGGGGLLLVVAALLGVRYVRTRRTTLLVDRFGGDPVRVPAPRRDGERAATALSAALADDG
jgi:hypothetical protein